MKKINLLSKRLLLFRIQSFLCLGHKLWCLKTLNCLLFVILFLSFQEDHWIVLLSPRFNHTGHSFSPYVTKHQRSTLVLIWNPLLCDEGVSLSSNFLFEMLFTERSGMICSRTITIWRRSGRLVLTDNYGAADSAAYAGR